MAHLKPGPKRIAESTGNLTEDKGIIKTLPAIHPH